MKYPAKNYACLLLLLGLFVVSCKKNIFDAHGWQPRILGPVATGTISAETVGDIRNKYFEQIIDPYNTGVSRGFVPFVPALNINHLGPYPNLISSYFQYAQIDTANVVVTFLNNFPTVVKAGTTIVLRSAADTTNAANIILSQPITSDIAPNTSYSFTLVKSNQYLPSQVYLYLDHFQTDSASNVTFSNSSSKVSFNLNILKIKLLAINTNRSYTMNDTTGFQLSSGSSGSMPDSGIAGTFKIILNNRLPVNFSTQLIFLDANKNVIDSLIHQNYKVDAATTDNNGNSLNSIPLTLQVPVNNARLQLLQQSKYIVFRVSADSYNLPGSTVVANDNSGADFQLISDLQIQMGNFLN
jgi:hypothetical protein